MESRIYNFLAVTLLPLSFFKALSKFAINLQLPNVCLHCMIMITAIVQNQIYNSLPVGTKLYLVNHTATWITISNQVLDNVLLLILTPSVTLMKW